MLSCAIAPLLSLQISAFVPSRTCAGSVVLVPRVTAAWQHALANVRPGSALAFQNSGAEIRFPPRIKCGAGFFLDAL
jgi:hypothetical protein